MAQAPRKKSLLFAKYPNISYKFSFDSNPEGVIVKNLLTRAAIKDIVKQNGKIFYEYEMQEGDTPEMIAHKYYEDVSLHWIILMTNDIFDGQFGLGMNYQTFTNYLKSKYPGITLNANSFSGDIMSGSRITGITSGAIGTVDSWNPSTGRISIEPKSGSFIKGEQAETVIVLDDGRHDGSLSFGQYLIASTHATHHYENTLNGDILDYTQFLETLVEERREVSNILYETELNDAKRRIKLIKPLYVQQIVEQMSTVLNLKKNVV